MDVILLEQIQGVGTLGETVSVSRGYARNFLLPRGKALPASAENLAKFEAERKDREASMAEGRTRAEELATQFTDLTVMIKRQASETGVLYGSVKARDIEAALAEKSITVARSEIQIGTPIKEVGNHDVKVYLHPEVVVSLNVAVERQSTTA
ncbi:MAG: 50S ribosomal protein L9 [Alphaproteobacteria bacterium]|nr:50S ribosomal protein L9 [Alphaproteobacteria bacterium]MDD9919502.1 50S ribosomal protein L9 [Alphaproteobacteria bacterium]